MTHPPIQIECLSHVGDKLSSSDVELAFPFQQFHQGRRERDNFTTRTRKERIIMLLCVEQEAVQNSNKRAMRGVDPKRRDVLETVRKGLLAPGSASQHAAEKPSEAPGSRPGRKVSSSSRLSNNILPGNRVEVVHENANGS
jgi:hypothetical protein